MIDIEGYRKARTYFLDLYRSHLEAARAWRGHNRKQEAWALDLAAACREKLIRGARLQRDRELLDGGR